MMWCQVPVSYTHLDVYKRQGKDPTLKKRINDVVYRIQQEGQRKFKVVHIDRLAKYYFRDGLPVRDERLKEGAVLRHHTTIYVFL